MIRRRGGDFAGAWFVDLGYGKDPTTTLESAERLRRLNETLPILGVEIDTERVAVAQTYADDLTHFRVGGFNLPLQTGADGRTETVRAIRAFNVLRQYDKADVAAAHKQLSSYLLPDGLLLEGTSSLFGRLWVANLIRRVDPEQVMMEALVFSTNFRLEFDPAQFQPVLPKNHIHRVVPGESIYNFFKAWKSAYRETMPYRSLGPRQHFVAAGRALAQRGYAVSTRNKWLSKGYLIWKINFEL